MNTETTIRPGSIAEVNETQRKLNRRMPSIIEARLAKRLKPHCPKCGKSFTMKRHVCKPTSLSDATLKVGPL